VLENGPVWGIHAHLCFHRPTGLGRKFSNALKRWAKALVSDYKASGEGKTVETKRRRSDRVWCMADKYDELEDRWYKRPYLETHYNTKNMLAYCLKGLSPDGERAQLITKWSLTGKRRKPTPWKAGYQGAIEGRRCGVSNNIGWTARARFENEVISFPELVAPPSDVMPMRA